MAHLKTVGALPQKVLTIALVYYVPFCDPLSRSFLPISGPRGQHAVISLHLGNIRLDDDPPFLMSCGLHSPRAHPAESRSGTEATLPTLTSFPDVLCIARFNSFPPNGPLKDLSRALGSLKM